VADDVGPLVRQFFSAGEIAAWQALPAEQRGRAFYDGWTRKEAYLKALGVGLGRSPQSFSVSLNVEPPVQWLHDPQTRDVRGGWWLGTGGLDAQHSLAVVVERVGPVAVRRCQLRGLLSPWS
jgi:4'-phosphopantetheinyl transferase